MIRAGSVEFETIRGGLLFGARNVAGAPLRTVQKLGTVRRHRRPSDNPGYS